MDDDDRSVWRAAQPASGGPAAADQTRMANAANETTGITGGSWVSPTYDAAGNTTSGPKAGDEATRLWYVYDAWNRLVTVKNDDGAGNPGTTLATYAYDGLNRRVSKTTGGHTDDSYFNDQWQVLEVRRDGDADPREQYVWDQMYVDTPAVRFLDANTDGDYADTGDNTLYYLTDANHDVTAVFDAGTQQVAERYVYNPYGIVTIFDPTWSSVRTFSSVDNNSLFAGYSRDVETGYFYARNRYYDPALGTWITRDPLNYVDGPNLYGYVRSNPIIATDPSGTSLFCKCVLFGVPRRPLGTCTAGSVAVVIANGVCGAKNGNDIMNCFCVYSGPVCITSFIWTCTGGGWTFTSSSSGGCS